MYLTKGSVELTFCRLGSLGFSLGRSIPEEGAEDGHFRAFGHEVIVDIGGSARAEGKGRDKGLIPCFGPRASKPPFCLLDKGLYPPLHGLADLLFPAGQKGQLQALG
jgi:hypothetical protein